MTNPSEGNQDNSDPVPMPKHLRCKQNLAKRTRGFLPYGLVGGMRRVEERKKTRQNDE